MKRVEASDPNAMYMLAHSYYVGEQSFPQDQTKAMEFYTRATDLGFRTGWRLL